MYKKMLSLIKDTHSLKLSKNRNRPQWRFFYALERGDTISADVTFSTELPDFSELIKKLDMFDENVNKAVRSALNEGADMIVAEQKRLISGKSERLAENISKSRIYTTKKGRIGISAGYQPDAFEYDADGFNPGVVGMVHEFGRPGQSPERKGDKMIQERHKKQVEVSKGTIQPTPHIRRGFDNVREKAVKLVIDAVEKEVDKLGDS